MQFLEVVAAAFLLRFALSCSGKFVLNRCVAGVFLKETSEDLAAFTEPLEVVQGLDLAG